MSQQNTTSTVIDGATYIVRHLSPDDALDLLVDLGKSFGPGIAAAFDALERAGAGGQGDEDVLLRHAIESFVASADKATYRRIVETMMRVTSAVAADGTTTPMVLEGSAVWKLHFQGKLGALLRVVGFALRANYADFFGDIGRIRTWATNLRAGTPTPAP